MSEYSEYLDDEELEEEEFLARERETGDERKLGAIRRDWKLLPRAMPYLKPYRKLAAVSIILTVLLAALALAEPWPLAFVIDGILGEESTPA